MHLLTNENPKYAKNNSDLALNHTSQKVMQMQLATGNYCFIIKFKANHVKIYILLKFIYCVKFGQERSGLKGKITRFILFKKKNQERKKKQTVPCKGKMVWFFYSAHQFSEIIWYPRVEQQNRLKMVSKNFQLNAELAIQYAILSHHFMFSNMFHLEYHTILLFLS